MHFVSVDTIANADQPNLYTPPLPLSACPPFPWSREVWEGRNCIFNLVACDNSFEREFAKFLDNARDVKAFAKLPQAFGFCIEYVDTAMNLRHYYPDFVAVDAEGTHWLLETKGREDDDVPRKDAAAAQWCENAEMLTKTKWQYRKVLQEQIQLDQINDLKTLTLSFANNTFLWHQKIKI